jgi:beta-lactamase class D
MKFKIQLFATVLLIMSNNILADGDSQLIAELFKSHGVEGTLVVANVQGQTLSVHNPSRAEQRFSPASTFKILNTLIALENGVLKGQEDRFKWDGISRSVSAWNRDHTLNSAFRASCVWCYQDIATSIGLVNYREKLAEISYGNREVGKGVRTFWLDGTLKISADEQITFLSDVMNGEYAWLTDRSLKILESIMQLDGAQETVFAKSGWTGPELAVGWYVGFLRKDDELFLFALNMKLTDATQAHLRKDLTLQALQLIGLLE